jgi:hypothetical protein
MGTEKEFEKIMGNCTVFKKWPKLTKNLIFLEIVENNGKF